MERTPAVAVIFHHIGPYHHARLNAAADKLPVIGIEWSARAHDAWGVAATPARYRKVSLFPDATDHYPDKAKLRDELWATLEQATPDVVAVNGWNNFGSLIAANCCVHRGLPMVVMSESSRQDEPRSWWKEAVKRRIVSLYSAALVGGQRHADYLVELGMPRERIFTGYDVVDTEYFGRRTQEIRDSNLKFQIQTEHGLPENYFLVSARFIEKKNLVRLISAYAEYRRKSQMAGPAVWDLVILGDGPLRETLISQISALNLNEHVYLPGFKPYEELPVYYAFANAFVHPSTTEQWGLVINEAMASRLPVIVSDRCGCVPDVIRDNGFTFDPTDGGELTARLLEMSSMPNERRGQLGENSSRIASNFTPERFGEGLKRAAAVATGIAKKSFGVIDRGLLLVTGNYAR